MILKRILLLLTRILIWGEHCLFLFTQSTIYMHNSDLDLPQERGSGWADHLDEI